MPGTPPPTRAALTLQLKLPCASLDAVRARYGPELAQARFTVRTPRPRSMGTLVRLTCTLSDGQPAFRAAAEVLRAIEGSEGWMELKLLGMDEPGRALVESAGGPKLRALKLEAFQSAPGRSVLDALGSQPGKPKPTPPAATTAAPRAQPIELAPPADEKSGVLGPNMVIAALGLELRAARISIAGEPGDRPLNFQLASVGMRGSLAETLRAAGEAAASVATLSPELRVAIAVPAACASARLEELARALAEVGWSDARVIATPLAIAASCRSIAWEEQPYAGRVLICELGHQGCTASLVELGPEKGSEKLLASRTDHALGGRDFDRALLEPLRAVFREQHHREPPADPETERSLLALAETAKIALSDSLEARVRGTLASEGGPLALDGMVSRGELVLASSPLIDRVLALCSQIMREQNLSSRDLRDVVLLGGPARMPLLRERMRAWFGIEPGRSNLSSLESVASSGAASLANLARSAPSRPAEEIVATATINEHAKHPPARKGWLRGLFSKKD